MTQLPFGINDNKYKSSLFLRFPIAVSEQPLQFHVEEFEYDDEAGRKHAIETACARRKSLFLDVYGITAPDDFYAPCIRKMSKNNSSGEQGVALRTEHKVQTHNGKTYRYEQDFVQATWQERRDGKSALQRKNFSVKKYGTADAWQNAVNYRHDKLVRNIVLPQLSVYPEILQE